MSKRKFSHEFIRKTLNEVEIQSDSESDDSVVDPVLDFHESADDGHFSDDGGIMKYILQQLALEEDEAEENEIIEEDYGEQKYQSGDIQWSEYIGRHKSFPFTGKKGLQKDISPESTPLDIFSLLVDDAVINHIVRETNRFAQQCFASRQHKKWTETNAEEIKKFFGLIIWMGLVRVSFLPNYWSTQGIYKMEIPRSIMPRNRFQMLFSMLHFNNNETLEEGDCLSKVKPLLDLLEHNFKTFFIPEEEIVINVSLVPWRGHLIFRQYIPNKAHHYGIKVFKLCSVGGYTWGMKIYSGHLETGEREIGLTKNICLELMSQLLNQGRTLYIDNFYTSFELARCFLKRQTHVVGTLKANKKDIPKDVLDAKLKRGEMIAKEEENGIVVLKWKDTREMRILSTKHAPVMVSINQAWQTQNELPQQQSSCQSQVSSMSTINTLPQASTSNITKLSSTLTRGWRSRKATSKPLAVLAYRKGKSGINLSDQICSYVSTLRKGIKWYQKLGIETILGIAIVNAWVIYKKATQKKITIRSFRETLTSSLLQIKPQERHIPQRSFENMHQLTERKDQKGKKLRRKCSECYAKMQVEKGREEARKRAKMVYTYCDKCPDQPQLCLKCFNLKHN